MRAWVRLGRLHTLAPCRARPPTTSVVACLAGRAPAPLLHLPARHVLRAVAAVGAAPAAAGGTAGAGAAALVAAAASALALAAGRAALSCEEAVLYPEVGEWRQDPSASESLVPFLNGLGVPRLAARLVDGIRVDLRITCDDGRLMVVDQTLFGSNTTEVVLGAPEVERKTRGGRKSFMMSGFEQDGRLVVQCRLFQRGDGWVSQQSWGVRGDGVLEERMVLKRPDQDDIIVTRVFLRSGSAHAAAGAGHPAGAGAAEAGSGATRASVHRLGAACAVVGCVAVALAAPCCAAWTPFGKER
mmetsp:Transcript_64436/g.197101  ORF Transcript_64436/g.197101 Transcript_64436/m.197101 type:complete len:300 (-) Transcript_64436:64-963(-)